MNETTGKIVLEIVKAGGILVGLLVAFLFVILLLKFGGPLIGMAKGSGELREQLGRIATLLEGLQGLPVAITTLSGSVGALAASIPTKQELAEGLMLNRHDARDTMAAMEHRVVRAIDRQTRSRNAQRKRSGHRR